MKASLFVTVASLAFVAVTPATALAQQAVAPDTPEAVAIEQSSTESAVTGTQDETAIVGEVGGPEIAANTATGFTRDTVKPDKPFADLNIDLAASPDQINAGLTVAQREELLGRCSVIVTHELDYDTKTATFCKSYSSVQ